MWSDVSYELGNRGLEVAFLNCVSMTNISLPRDILYDNSSTISYATGAFAGCKNLVSVDLADYFKNPHVAITKHMFEGCIRLETITGVINISAMDSPEHNAKDMFKGCSSLQSVTIVCGNVPNVREDNDIRNISSFSGKYIYAEMGLTAEQMVNCVTIINPYE